MMQRLNNEKGAVYPLAVFLIPVLLIMAGLLIDGGMAVYQHTKLTSAVDAAALASLDAYDRDVWEENQEVVINPNDARRFANMYLTTNMSDATLTSVQVDNTSVTVRAEATATLFFMSMFGQSDFTIEAMARASLDDTVTEDED